VETGRDLACPELWQHSLERSLARRGRATRSSLELSHLRPERDLSRPDLLRESLMYSQLRRSATTRRVSMAVPGAGGISALALLAAATLPGLAGGRTGGRARAVAVDHATAADAATVSRSTPPSVVTTHPAAVAAIPAPAHASSTSRSSGHPMHALPPAKASGHVAVARDATGGVAHAQSGGAAPPAPRLSAGAPRVPADPQPHGHPSTGGGAIEDVSHPAVKSTPAHALARAHTPPATRLHPAKAAPQPATSTHPVAATHPAAKAPAHPAPATPHPVKAAPHPVTSTHPVTNTHPVTSTHPVAATHPAPKPQAPAPPPPASGGYTNPLAGAHVTPERIDQGVDYSGSGTLSALGAGKVTYVGTSGTGWPGAFVEYQLTGGSYAGRYVYYAEAINPEPGLEVGDTLRPGQPVAEIIPNSSGGIEIGWASGVGTQPLAQALGQWSGGDDANSVPSPAGKSFSALIAQLGGPPGKVEG
jgi:hypothetical protein